MGLRMKNFNILYMVTSTIVTCVLVLLKVLQNCMLRGMGKHSNFLLVKSTELVKLTFFS